jgi:hypothetical protein
MHPRKRTGNEATKISAFHKLSWYLKPPAVAGKLYNRSELMDERKEGLAAGRRT